MKFLLLVLSIFTLQRIVSMDKPCSIRLEPAQKEQSKKAIYRIDAYCQEKRIGFARYELLKDKASGTILEISQILINPLFRKKGVGYKLFFECYKYALQKHIPRIEWSLIPQDDKLTQEQLIDIYKQMVKKLPKEPSFIFEQQGKGYGLQMAIIFN